MKDYSIKNCEVCGEEYKPNCHNSRYCCSECRKEAGYKLKRDKHIYTEITKNCDICNKIFISNHPLYKYCSDKCKEKGALKVSQINIMIDICPKCNNKEELHFNKEEQRYICHKCRCKKYEREKAICNVCGELEEIKIRVNNNPVCDGCYKKQLQPKEICSGCGELRIINKRENNGDILCKSCYKTPKAICSLCEKEKPVIKRTEKYIICNGCYNKWKRENNPSFDIERRIRDRLASALKAYSRNGKVKTADEYGVNYKAIIEHLGPCPGNRKDYHIDHIKPLCLFDFNDLEQIKLAFAPENHQWLTKEENLRKGDKY